MSSNEDAFELLSRELGNEPDASKDDDTQAEDTQVDDTQVDDVSANDQEDAKSESQDDDDDSADSDTNYDNDDDDGKPTASQTADDTQVTERPSSKDDIKQALRELESERVADHQYRNNLRNEVRAKLYKGQLDRPILDSANQPINGVNDMIGKLIDPETGEPFERDGAERWWNATKTEQDKLVEGIEQDIDKIAETNQTLFQEYQQLASKYGEFIEANPEISERVLRSWEGTLKRDKATNIVLEAPVSLIGYYDMALAPYVQMANQQAQAQAEADAKATAVQAKADQSDRADLSPTSDGGKGGKVDVLDKAFSNYFKGNK